MSISQSLFYKGPSRTADTIYRRVISGRPKTGGNPLGTHIGLFLQMRAGHSHTLQSIASPYSALSFFVVELWYHENVWQHFQRQARLLAFGTANSVAAAAVIGGC